MSLLHDHIDDAYAEIKRLKAERDQQKANNRSRLECLARMESELAEARKDAQLMAEQVKLVREQRNVSRTLHGNTAKRLTAALQENKRLRDFLECGGIDSSAVLAGEEDGTWTDENERLQAELAKAREALVHGGKLQISQGHCDSIAYHLEQGYDNGKIPKEKLAGFLRGLAIAIRTALDAAMGGAE